MYRYDVTKSDRGEGREAEIDKIGWQRHPILDLEASERSGSEDADQCVQRHEHDPDREIEQYGADHAMIGDPSRAEYSAGDDPDGHKADQQPASCFATDIECDL